MKSAIKLLIITSVLIFITSLTSYADNFSWSYSDNILTISGTGEIKNYTRDTSAPWKIYSDTAKKLVISEGITSIGDWNFYNFTSLENIEFPSTLEKIGKRAFYNCSSLTNIKIPQNVAIIDDGAFNGCLSVIRVDLNEGLKKIGNSAFMNMPELSAIILPSTVEYIGDYAFFGNTSFGGLYFKGPALKFLGKYTMYDSLDDYMVYYNTSYFTEWDESGFVDREHGYIYNADNFISVYLNNSLINFDQQPIIVNSRALVPVRAIFEAMGATVDFNDGTSTVIATIGDTQVLIPINSNTMYKNNEAVNLDVPAIIKKKRTLVPVRAITEAFGATVLWNPDTRSIDINF